MNVIDRLRWLVITGGGLGLAPILPGTFGTLPGVALAWGAEQSVEPGFVPKANLGVAALLLIWGCRQTGFVLRVFRSKDPSRFVLDEIVGYLFAAALFTALMGPLGPIGHLWCFVWFRVFDITKLWPTNLLERVPGAYGIMLDDVMAGIYAGAATAGCAWMGWVVTG